MKIFLFTLLVGAVWTKPAPAHDPMETPGLYEGDILGIKDRKDRNGIPTDEQRWPEGVIPYIIDSSLETYEDEIRRAMDHIEETTCITFVERTDERDYVKLFYGEGCNSHWGRTGGQQPLSLGNGCQRFGTYLHELMHAIGFEHEHNRSDRDEYVTIHWENIRIGWDDAFKKLKKENERLFTSYDFDSIMHYGPTAFSKGPKYITITSNKGIEFDSAYNKKALSPGDITRVKLLYKC